MCRATTRTLVLSWCFLWSSGCAPVLADQTLDDVGALEFPLNVESAWDTVARFPRHRGDSEGCPGQAVPVLTMLMMRHYTNA